MAAFYNAVKLRLYSIVVVICIRIAVSSHCHLIAIVFYPHDAMLVRSLRQRRVWTSVRHTPVLCLAQRKQDREMYTADSPITLVSSEV